MPWKNAHLMSIRHNFVLQALSPGSNISALCRDYNVSRKTGYKWLHRYRIGGVLALDNLDRGPSAGRPLKVSAEMAIEVLNIRDAHPTWGARKLQVMLKRQYPAKEVPSERTIGRILTRAGRVKPRRVRGRKSSPSKRPNLEITGSNQVWTVDFKGWWRTGTGRRVEPLTVRDAHSRFLLAVRVPRTIRTEDVRPIFEELFRRFGMPDAILSDNGSPFASRGQSGLTKLSAWWVALGIQHVRSRPGCPQDNGGHERMHLDMKRELQNHPAWNVEEQQVACERWRHEFNEVRPHEALGQATPSSVYRRSKRVFPSSALQCVYPSEWSTRRVQKGGTVRYNGYQRHVSAALRGYDIGFESLDGPYFRVWFAGLCLGVGRLPWKQPLRPPGTDVTQL